jgi:UMF1 family MFS transporter
VAVAVRPAYFAAAGVPEGGVAVGGARLSAASLWGYLVSATALVVFVLAPPLGAVADHLGLRRRLLLAFCVCGSLAATGLVAIGPGTVWPAMGLFFVAQVGFVGGNVFYDSLLGHVAPPGRLDAVSGRGFAYGYVGGGVQFALALGLVAGTRPWAWGADLAARLAMASAGLWWLGFGLWAVRGMDEPPGAAGASGGAPVREALGRLRGLWGRARAVPGLVPFMLAFLCYNDGVQTTISMATIYGSTELGLSTTVLMLTLLMIQFVSVFGALAFSRTPYRPPCRTISGSSSRSSSRLGMTMP